ncbi:MAG: hypothetical protein A2V66_03575 [Ignavibacteria bacterium RBG_13_36_8]|nr:MAG: hypothetical protein A2V66_03575 [Ignavibacteria bacterium RBG_13_36_8]
MKYKVTVMGRCRSGDKGCDEMIMRFWRKPKDLNKAILERAKAKNWWMNNLEIVDIKEITKQ